MAKGSESKPLDLIVSNGILVIPGVGQIKADVGISEGKIAVIGENLKNPVPKPMTPPGAWCRPGFSTRTSISAMSNPTKARPKPKPVPPSSAG